MSDRIKFRRILPEHRPARPIYWALGMMVLVILLIYFLRGF